MIATAALFAVLCQIAQQTPGGGSRLEARFQEAVTALARQDLTAAEQGFQAVLKQSPNHVGALGNLGVVYSRMNRFQDSIRVYSRALKLAPDEPGLLLNLGLAYLKRNDHARARPLFERLAKQGAPSTQVRELLATTRLYTGDADLALADLAELRKQEPYNSGVLYLSAIANLKRKNRAAAAEAFDELLRVLKPGPAHVLTGKAYFENGLFEEALSEFKAALTADSSLAGLHLELGKAHTSLRQQEDAERELREALRQSPNDSEAAYFLGALLTQTDRVDEGIALLERVRRQEPDSWGAAYYLGKARLGQGKAVDALTLLNAAARLNPDQSAVWLQLSRAARSAGLAAQSQAALRKYESLRQSRTAAEEPLVVR